MRKIVVAGVGALALALGTAAPALADSGYGKTSTEIKPADCGTAVIIWTNHTPDTFYGDWRKGTDTGAGEVGEVDPNGTIEEGPLEGQKFGKIYHLTEVAAGETVKHEVAIDPGEGSVLLRAWVKRGPEQHSFSAANPVELKRCAPADDGDDTTTPPPAGDGDGDETGDGTTPPTHDGDDTGKTDGDDNAKGNGDTATEDDDSTDDGADMADENGTAPTPEPQEAHIAVTG